MSMQDIVLNVNGIDYELKIRSTRSLADVLREDIGLIGTKLFCNEGECGSCTVLIDGKPMLSCLTLAIECEGKDILTIEGLAVDGTLHPIQEAFVQHGAIQCGFCTSGMVLTAKALIDNNSKPSEEEVRKAIEGNMCRCTGYVKIVEAIMSVSETQS